MPTIGIADFSGMLPLRDPILLPDSNSQYSYNTWLYRGAIRGFRYSDPIVTLLRSTSKQIYRIPADAAISVYDWVASLWLEFPDPFITSHQSPVVEDEFNRFYFFPSDEFVADAGNWPQVPFYAPKANLPGGPIYVLGIPVPTVQPEVEPASTVINIFANADTPAGGNVLTFVDTSGISVGMEVLDLTANGFNAQTNAPSTVGTDTLFFATTAGILLGSVVTDQTSPSAIPFGTTILSVSPTFIVLSANVQTPGVSSGDNIIFSAANPIPAGTTVISITPTTVTLSGPTVGAGVFAGDIINFTSVLEARSYLYTYVSAYNEEGAPSVPSGIVNGSSNGVWQVTVWSPTTDQLDGHDLGVSQVGSGRNLASINIYRTVTDSSGNAQFYFVTNIPITTPGAPITYEDGQDDPSIANNLVLLSTFYTPPPAGLQGVVAMANGIWAGWTNEREIWFSEPFLPHAWPANYALTVDYPVVGLAAIGSSLNIHTQGQPFIATGTTPDTMTIGKVTANEPCVSRGSIFVAGEGSYYASPNGLVLLNTSGTINVTQYSMDREFWNSLNPVTWAVGRMGITYIAYNKGVAGPTGTLAGVVIDHLDKNVPCSYLAPPLGLAVVNLYWDEISGQIFTITTDKNVRWLFPFTGKLLPWVFKSKKFRLPKPAQLMAFKTNFEVPPEITITPPTPASRNVSQSQVFNPATQYLIIRVYADGNQVLVQEIVQDNEILKIPNGLKATYWEFQLEGQVYVFLLKVASSVKELIKA